MNRPDVCYCKNCVWFKRKWLPPFEKQCTHPSNWVDTWLEKVRRPPSRINRNNDCKWYDENPFSEPESKSD